MAEMNLNNDDRRQLASLLVKRGGVQSATSRQMLVERAGVAEVLGKLDLSASAELFAWQLVSELQQLGTLASTGQPALVSLVLELQERVRGHEDEVAFLTRLLVPHGQAAGASPTPDTSRLRVMFLAADPLREEAQTLGEEVQAIDERLRESRLPERFDLRQHHAVRWPELSRHLLDDQPHIVHLACPTDEDGNLVMPADDGGTALVTDSVLADLFTALKDNVWCIFLSGDGIARLAERLATVVDFTVGFVGPVKPEARIHMAAGFYRGLAFQRPVAKAFDLGRIEMSGIDPAFARIPRLYARQATATRSVPGYSPPPAALDDLIAEYLLQQTVEAADVYRRLYVSLEGEARHRAPAMALDVGLRRGSVRQTTTRNLSALLGPAAGTYAGDEDARREPVPDVCERLGQVRRGVLLGMPGTGKTWTLNRLFIMHADAWLNASPEARSGLLVPVLVPLREFKGLEGDSPLDFPAFVRGRMGELGRHLDELVADRRLLLICDALNEMPRSPGRGDTARDLVAEVRALLGSVPRFVVSCRELDYRDDLAELRPLEQVYLSDLDPPRIREIVHRRFATDEVRAESVWQELGGSDEVLTLWSWCSAADLSDQFWDKAGRLDEQLRERRAELPGNSYWSFRQAWRQMHGDRALMPLCRNPFMLGVVCDIAEASESLPGNRVDLFQQFVVLSLRREKELAERRGQPWKPDAGPRLEKVLVEFAQLLQEGAVTAVARPSAEAAIDCPDAGWYFDTALMAGILAETGGSLGFSHQLLQEFFAVQVMLQALEANENPIRFFDDGEGWWDPGPWRETTVILGEFLGERAAGPNRVAQWLAPISPEVGLDVIRRNGEGLAVDDVEVGTREALIAGARALADEPHPHGRAAAWRVLGDLDADDRPGVGLRPDGLPDVLRTMCEVPAGSVEIEGGVGRQSVGSFQIAMYPVTYAQYRAFLEAQDGYGNPRWRREPVSLAEKEAPPGEQVWPTDNHPAENVSWYDAMAFCSWLTARLTAGLPTGTVIRLPTEAEWQLAAGGPSAFEYPWGPDYFAGHANVDGSSEDGGYFVQRTTAVGIYPDGAAECGGLDLSGNVWEWTLSECEGGKNGDLTNDRPRGVRGGPGRATTRGVPARRTAAGATRSTVTGTTGFGWWWPPLPL